MDCEKSDICTDCANYYFCSLITDDLKIIELRNRWAGGLFLDSDEWEFILGHVEVLQKRIAELEAERRWIPVSERLPDYDVFVIVHGTVGGVQEARYLENKQAFWSLTGPIKTRVTHWQPLPKPPEVE